MTVNNDLTKYVEYKPMINTGDLGLWFTEGLGDIIELFQDHDFLKEKVDHASIFLRLNGIRTSRLFNYESLTDGFNPHFLSTELRKHNGQVYWFKLLDWTKRGEIEDRIFMYDGTPYDYPGLFKMAVTRPEINTKQMICSVAIQAAAAGAKDGDLALAPWELLTMGLWERVPRRLV